MARKTYYMAAGTRSSAPRGTSESDTNTVVEGVAKTGQTSDKGTVAHTEHRSGRVDASVRPKPMTVKIGVQR